MLPDFPQAMVAHFEVLRAVAASLYLQRSIPFLNEDPDLKH